MFLRVSPEDGGRSRPHAGRFLVGPPELVIEVANSSEANDLHAKREDYRRTGVLEYVVLTIRDRRRPAFDSSAGHDLTVGPDGIHRARVCPGLALLEAKTPAAETAPPE